MLKFRELCDKNNGQTCYLIYGDRVNDNEELIPVALAIAQEYGMTAEDLDMIEQEQILEMMCEGKIIFSLCEPCEHPEWYLQTAFLMLLDDDKILDPNDGKKYWAIIDVRDWPGSGETFYERYETKEEAEEYLLKEIKSCGDELKSFWKIEKKTGLPTPDVRQYERWNYTVKHTDARVVVMNYVTGEIVAYRDIEEKVQTLGWKEAKWSDFYKREDTNDRKRSSDLFT